MVAGMVAWAHKPGPKPGTKKKCKPEGMEEEDVSASGVRTAFNNLFSLGPGGLGVAWRAEKPVSASAMEPPGGLDGCGAAGGRAAAVTAAAGCGACGRGFAFRFFLGLGGIVRQYPSVATPSTPSASGTECPNDEIVFSIARSDLYVAPGFSS